MKFSLNFDVAVLIALLGGFLYWCGHWYDDGYISFFGYSSNIFNSSTILVVIDGFIVAVDQFLYLTILIIFLIFFSSLSIKDYEYNISILVLIFAVISTRLFYILFGRFYYRSTYYLNKYNKITIFNPRPPSKIKTFYIKIKQTHEEASLYTKRVLTNHRLTLNEIKEDSYGSNYEIESVANIAIFRIFFSFIGLSLIIFFIFWCLGNGSNLQATGKEQACKNFVASFKLTQNCDDPKISHNVKSTYIHHFPKVESTKKDELKAFRLTDLCNNGICVLIDNEKRVKTFEIKQLTVINNEVTGSKNK